MKGADQIDPLHNPAFRSPGIFESLRELFLGSQRPLDCVQIEVTSCCQSRCSYCPRAIHARTWQSRHMSAEVFASLWPILCKAKRAHLQGWGEPLLNPRFFDFQALAQKAGCATSTTTCGAIITPDLAAKLAASGLDIIAFSLVGTDEQSNAARGGASFEKVRNGIALLQAELAKKHPAERPEIHFAYLLLPDQLEAIKALPDLMDDLDVSTAVISTMDYIASPDQAGNAFYPDQDHSEAEAILAEAASRAERMGRAIHYDLPGGRKQICRENINATLFVSAEGDISPCVYLNVPEGRPESCKKVFGNSLQKDAWQIWEQADFHKFRADMAAGRPDVVCEDCAKLYQG